MTYCGVEPTQEEIDCFRQRLQKQANVWIEAQENTFLLKLNVFKVELPKKLTPGKLSQSLSLVKSRNNLTNASLQKKQRLLNTKSVWMKEELPNVLNLENT